MVLTADLIGEGEDRVMAEIAIGVVGCAGRMGQALLRLIAQAEDCRIAGGTEAPGGDALGRDIGTLIGLEPSGVTVSDDAAALFAASDVVLDFTVPEATMQHVALARQSGTALVVGTTGTTVEQDAEIEAAGAHAAILRAANMSLGVNLLLALTRQVAAALDEDFDIEIVEMHHRHKIDAPSGTALALGRAAAVGRGIVHDECAERGRDGITGARARGAIGYAALRGGNVAGEHTVIFATDDERVELTHKAGDRAIFARGALRAARWLAGRPPGFYGMPDVLGLPR